MTALRAFGTLKGVSVLLLAVGLWATPTSADPCVPAEDDPLLQAHQLRVVESASTAEAAWEALNPPRIHPDTWGHLHRRFPGALEVPLLTLGAASPGGRALSRQHGPHAILKRLSDRDALIRARVLLGAHQNEAAMAFASAALEGPHEVRNDKLRCRLHYIRGKAARKLRRYKMARAWLESGAEACWKVDPAFGLRSVLLRARVERILGNAGGLRAAADIIESKAGLHRYWDDVVFLHADLLEAREDPGASRLYERVIARAPTSDHAHRAAGRLARAARGKERKARFEAWRRYSMPSLERDQAQYWWADALEAEGERVQSQTLFEELAHRYSFYGRLALDRLDARRRSEVMAHLLNTVASEPKAPSTRAVEAVLDTAAGRAARDLAERGRTEDAGVMIRGWGCQARRSPEERWAAASWLHEVGAFTDAQLILRPAQERLLESRRLGPDNIGAWFIAYSRPYSSQVRAAARAEDLDPYLLWALAREESRFDPDVVSWAGAIGLSQLMPPTARGAYRSVHGQGLASLERLTDPALNLRLGARVLAEGLNRFGSAPLALSAYNGGPGLTSGFLKRGHGRFDAFAESISVPQTRGYVKRVTESWGRYRLLYDRGRPIIPLPDRVP
ncbi:MAG: transglycosylase SLT domain-containing protein [Myxococcota bacterium]